MDQNYSEKKQTAVDRLQLLHSALYRHHRRRKRK